MKILIVTQDDNFYLPRPINDLVDKLMINHEVVGAVVLDPSPYGKKEKFLKKAIKTLSIFGIRFFTYYTILFIINQMKKVSVRNVLKKKNVKVINLSGSINKSTNVEMLRDTNADLIYVCYCQ